MGITPAIAQTNQGLTLNIPEYDGVGWGNEQKKTLSFAADFGSLDTTTPNKKLEINLPEGMRYETILVNGTVESLTGTDATLLSNINNTDPLYSGISKIKLPKKETAPMGATFGKLTYNFSPGVERAEITVIVSVDSTRYYGPHTVPNPITAVATKGDTNEVMGTVSQIIKANGTAIGGNAHAGNIGQAGTLNMLSGTNGKTNAISTQGLTDISATFKNKNLYAKAIEATLQYPVGSTLVSAIPSNYQLQSNDPTTGTVAYKLNGWGSTAKFEITFHIPTGATPGI